MKQEQMTLGDLLQRLPSSLHNVVADMLMRGEPMVVTPADELIPLHVRRYLGTDLIEGENLEWGVKNSEGRPVRLGRCYELSWCALTNAALHELLPSTTALIHGTIHGPEQENVRMGHGWLEIPTPNGKVVWEPFTAGLYDCDEWTRAVRARHERSYTTEQALVLSLQTGNTGRWHESRYP